MAAVGDETSGDLRVDVLANPAIPSGRHERSATYNTDIPIHSRDALVRVLLHESACDELLHGQHNAILAPDADRGAAVLYGFRGVFDLEVATIGGEDGVGKIVAGAY